MQKKFDYAVCIGRFQPCHLSHIKVIQNALMNSENIVICIGSVNKPRSPRNPFTFEERKQMIIDSMLEEFCRKPEKKTWSDAYPNFWCEPENLLKRVHFIPTRDYLYSDDRWVTEILGRFRELGVPKDSKIGLIGHEKDKSSYYLSLFPQWESYHVPNYDNISATDIRVNLFEETVETLESVSQPVKDTLHRFMAQEHYSDLKVWHNYIQNYKKERQSLKYPVVDVTVDCVVRMGGHILLIKRGENPGKGYWALPGGFISPDEKISESAVRELQEETDLKLHNHDLRSFVSKYQVFDHPERSSRGRVITHAFFFDIKLPQTLPFVVGQDDAKEARWIPVNELADMEQEIHEDHGDIIQYFIGA